MATRTIDANQLTPEKLIFVSGRVVYSHITSHIEGEELQQDMRRKQAMGMNPIDRPYTTITIKDAQIVPQNPGTMSLEETYVFEHMYSSKNDPMTKRWTSNSTGPYLPQVGQARQDNPMEVDEIVPLGELDTDLKVMLVLKVFRSKNGAHNNGIGLQQIIVQEPIRYYTTGLSGQLQERGLTFHPMPAEQKRKAMEEANAFQAQQNAAMANAGAADGTVGQPAASNVPQPNAQPFRNEPAKAQTPAAGTAGTSPQPAGTYQANPQTNFMNPPQDYPTPAAETVSPWVCPSCHTVNEAKSRFCSNCGTPAPVTAPQTNQNPYAANQPYQPAGGGIVYDADDTNRNY